MSNYVQTTFFAPKDLLLSGNPAKLIKGADVDPELAAIAAAIATKIDTSNAANPTGTVGLSAVNGVASTYMRSDAAPPLSQAIVPTWTGVHTFSAKPAFNAGATVTTGSGTAFVVTGVAAGISAQFTDGTTDFRISHSGGNTTVGTSTNTTFAIATNGTARISVTAAGSATFTGPSSATVAVVVNAQNVAGASNGMVIRGGTNSSDTGFKVSNAGNTLDYFQVRGDGAIQGMGATAAAFVDMTPDKGSFTVTMTGLTTAPTGTATWSRVGNLVTLNLPSVTAVSNAATCTFTGLPAEIQPATLTQFVPLMFEDNGTVAMRTVQVAAGSGTLTFCFSGVTTGGFTTVGTKGNPGAQTIAYLLN